MPVIHGTGLRTNASAKQEKAGAATVLLVDDPTGSEAFVRDAAARYRVVCATTASEGFEIVKGGGVDLAILEYRLPDVCGLELLAKLKTLIPRLPAIMITAFGSERICAAALKLGARDYFIKPVEPRELMHSLTLILSKTSRRQEVRESVFSSRVNEFCASRPNVRHRGSLDVRIHDAARFIRSHYADAICLRELAQVAGMSRFVFSRNFKAVMGVSFRRYLVQHRVGTAEELLEAGPHSITEIAHMVGFSDLPRFDKVFKQFVGLSPSAYRLTRTRTH